MVNGGYLHRPAAASPATGAQGAAAGGGGRRGAACDAVPGAGGGPAAAVARPAQPRPGDRPRRRPAAADHRGRTAGRAARRTPHRRARTRRRRAEQVGGKLGTSRDSLLRVRDFLLRVDVNGRIMTLGVNSPPPQKKTINSQNL